MVNRIIINNIALFIMHLGITLGQDLDQNENLQYSQDLYITFDQTKGNTNNLVTGAEYGFSLVGDIGSFSDADFHFSGW